MVLTLRVTGWLLAFVLLLSFLHPVGSGAMEETGAQYLTDQHVCVYVVNKGSKPVALKSVYLDGESYKIVTAEEMRTHRENWNIPPGKWEGWTWINPGEAFIYEQPIPSGVEANITMRPREAHYANTEHEIVLIFENGEEVKVKVICPAGDFTHQATFFTYPYGYMRAFYSDGTNVSLTIDERPEEFMKVLELANKVLAKFLKYVEARPWTTLKGEKYLELASTVPIYLDIPEESPYPPTGFRVYFVFTGKYAGYAIYHQFDCCTDDDVVWELEDTAPLKKLEKYIDELPAILSGAAPPPTTPPPTTTPPTTTTPPPTTPTPTTSTTPVQTTTTPSPTTSTPTVTTTSTTPTTPTATTTTPPPTTTTPPPTTPTPTTTTPSPTSTTPTTPTATTPTTPVPTTTTPTLTTPTPAPGMPMEWIAGIVILAVIIAAVAYYVRR